MLEAASLEAASFFNKEQEAYWLKLLHYKNGKSRAQGPAFFLSSMGRTNPEAELQATIETFKYPQKKIGQFALAPACAFPERFRFLNEVGLIQIAPPQCDDFENWKKGINAKSLTLVFSSAFPNDPSSMFGHTFVRFNQNLKDKNDLLDYGANYSAYIADPNPNPFEYAYRGIFGGYPGYFGFSPYYMKVNEYINAESRDLYEYDLNIPSERVDRLVNHLWEIYATTYFDYFFLDENCALMLADFIEIAMPDWEISKVGRPYYLPSDLIKKVWDTAGAVSSIHYRPSLHKKFKASLALLNKTQEKELQNLREEIILPRDVHDIQVLDTFLLAKEYERNKARAELQGKDLGAFREALLSRSKIKEKSSELHLSMDEKERPEFSHAPERLSLYSGANGNGALSGFTFKIGPHNQMADDTGLVNFGHFEFLTIDTEYDYKRKAFAFNQMQLIRITSLFAHEAYDPRLSWTAGGGIERLREENCFNCQRVQSDGGLGKTIFFANKNSVSLFLGSYLELSSHYEKILRAGPWSEFFFLGEIAEHYKYRLGTKIKSDVLSKWKTHYAWENSLAQTYFIKKNWELRHDFKWWSRYGSFSQAQYEHKLELAWYF